MRTIHNTYFCKQYLPFPQKFYAFSPTSVLASMREAWTALRCSFNQLFFLPFLFFGDSLHTDQRVTPPLWQQRQQSWWGGGQEKQADGMEEMQEPRAAPSTSHAALGPGQSQLSWFLITRWDGCSPPAPLPLFAPSTEVCRCNRLSWLMPTYTWGVIWVRVRERK